MFARMTTYYMGVYADGEQKVLQVADDIDCLSCEILAVPKLLTVSYATVRHMVNSAKEFARLNGCSNLEINCSKGKGSYRWLKI